MVRQQVLTLSFVGSNPTRPANKKIKVLGTNMEEKSLKQRLIELYQNKYLDLVFSALASLSMLVINLIMFLMKGSIVFLYYSIFCFQLTTTKIILFLMTLRQRNASMYLVFAILILRMIIPLALSMVATVLYKDKPQYIFDWIIYAYAFYATLKMTYAIINFNKYKKIDKAYKIISTRISLLGALYTVQMLEFALIQTFSEGTIPSWSIWFQMLTHFLIIAYAMYNVITLIIKFIKRNRHN